MKMSIFNRIMWNAESIPKDRQKYLENNHKNWMRKQVKFENNIKDMK